MKAGKLVKVLSIVLAVAMLAGCQYIFPKEEELQAPPLMESKEITYSTVDVVKGDITESVQGNGRFESIKIADVYFANGGGRIKKLNVKIGDTVKKGDPLVELDVGGLEYDLKRAKIQLQIQQNDYTNLKRHTSDKTARANAELALETAKLNVEQLQDQIDNSILKSPLNGSVTFVTNASQGSQVDSYATLVKVADQSEKMLTYIGTGDTVGKFQIGMKVQVELKNGGAKCEGEIVSTPFDREKYDSDTLNSMVFIKIPDDVMKNCAVGDEARLTLVLNERKGVLKLPKSAVHNYQVTRNFVRVLENGAQVEKDVELGLQTTTEVEILNGLTEGEKVIAN